MPEIKEIRPDYIDIYSQVLQDVLLRLKQAFDRFFERVKHGEKPGYPRFQGRNRYASFTYPQSGFSLAEKHITLSKIGTLKVKVHRTIEGTIKTCTIKHEAGQWYVIVSCEVEQPKPLPISYEDVELTWASRTSWPSPTEHSSSHRATTGRQRKNSRNCKKLSPARSAVLIDVRER